MPFPEISRNWPACPSCPQSTRKLSRHLNLNERVLFLGYTVDTFLFSSASSQREMISFFADSGKVLKHKK
jgi:uroporphyrinogen-III synthase